MFSDSSRILANQHRVESPFKYYEQWKINDYKPASISVIEREKNLDLAYAKIEKDFTLIGASAIEDRLQDQVPEVGFQNVLTWSSIDLIG